MRTLRLRVHIKFFGCPNTNTRAAVLPSVVCSCCDPHKIQLLRFKDVKVCWRGAVCSRVAALSLRPCFGGVFGLPASLPQKQESRAWKTILPPIMENYRARISFSTTSLLSTVWLSLGPLSYWWLVSNKEV